MPIRAEMAELPGRRVPFRPEKSYICELMPEKAVDKGNDIVSKTC